MTLYLGSKICKICYKRYLRRWHNYRQLIKNKTFQVKQFLKDYPDFNACIPQAPHVEGSAVHHSDEHILNEELSKKIKKRKRLDRKRKWRHHRHNDMIDGTADVLIDNTAAENSESFNNDENMESRVHLVENFLENHQVPESNKSKSDAEPSKRKIGTEQYDDSELLKILKQALDKERDADETDLIKYGSVIMNMLNVIAKGNVDHTTIGFKLNSSYWRRLKQNA